MRRHAANAMYGVLDYASYPLGMLAATPIILHHLGVAEYGLWMVVTSIVSAGSITACGFSDAGIQRVAKLRGEGKREQMERTVRSMFAIDLVLGCLVALGVWIAVPYIARHVTVSSQISLVECVACLHIACVMILVRAIEAIGVSTQRAFEDYRGTVQISTAVRLLTLAAAMLLARAGRSVESIMFVAATVLVAGTCLQFWNLNRLSGVGNLWPVFQADETRALLKTGVFVWLQALGSVIFRQMDRILLGVFAGALAVTPYALCVQFAEPLLGLTASGLSFFFPYLARSTGTVSDAILKRTILKVFLSNLLLVSGGAGVLFLFGARFLRLWAGADLARSAGPILPIVIAGSAVAGLSVTGTYAVQALGLFRVSAYISLGSRSGFLLLMPYLLQQHGPKGLAVARIFYAATTLFVYLPLIRHLGFSGKKSATLLVPVATELQGEARG